jgi:hypothetical protein
MATRTLLASVAVRRLRAAARTFRPPLAVRFQAPFGSEPQDRRHGRGAA